MDNRSAGARRGSPDQPWVRLDDLARTTMHHLGDPVVVLPEDVEEGLKDLAGASLERRLLDALRKRIYSSD